MKRFLYSVFALIAVALGLSVASFPEVAAVTTTTITSTIVGWLVPDAAHFSNTLIIFIFPLAGMVIVSMFPFMFHRKGDTVVYFALTGLFLGTILSDLSVNGTASNNAVPFAVIVVSGLLIFLWWWNS